MDKVLFSELSLGCKFKYEADSENIYVKIDILPGESCVALWIEENRKNNWVCQPVYSLSEDGEDLYVYVD